MSYLAHSAKPEQGIPAKDTPRTYRTSWPRLCGTRRMSRSSQNRSETCSSRLSGLAPSSTTWGSLTPRISAYFARVVANCRSDTKTPGLLIVLTERSSDSTRSPAYWFTAITQDFRVFAQKKEKGTGHTFRVEGLTPSGEQLAVYTAGVLNEYRGHHASVVGIPQSAAPPVFGGPTSTLFLRIALSCLVDADHSDTASHYQNAVAGPAQQLDPARRLEHLDSFVEKLGRGKDDERTRIRSDVYRECRDCCSTAGVLFCDSPVGSGKTTAVMAHLLRIAAAGPFVG